MKKIVTVVGARPQIIKAAAISRAIKSNFINEITEIIVHTGQHYDANMSQVFFDELGIPNSNYNLQVGSGSHGVQTAKMLEGIEQILLKEKPDAILVYGDTNSTLAGAIAASKLHIPVVHVEAGLRSFNKKMPEEINRILCDHSATLLFSPTDAGYQNLIREGFNANAQPPYNNDNPYIVHCGDVMYDNSLFFEQEAISKSEILKSISIPYVLVTVHRAENTDNPKALNQLFEAFNHFTQKFKMSIVLPLHPRTAHLLSKVLHADLYQSIKQNNLIQIIEPVSFLDMIALESNATLVATDSGGVQKEAYFFKKPCIILREQTEWTELVESGAAILTGTDKNKIDAAFETILNTELSLQFKPIFGNGKAADFICKSIIEKL
jgi:UDP-GlcNAc3NAcA epimerase